MSSFTPEQAEQIRTAEGKAERFRQVFAGLRKEIQGLFVGHDELVEQVVAAMLAGGHVLIEGVPGLGKTLLVRTLASAVDVAFSRIQFTPDLMPSDIMGTMVLYEGSGGGAELRFEPGPLIASIVLADEINRATPKTQSALLEAMQEHQVSVGRQTIKLPEPFMVLATQNPVEQEGTYPLPEAQLDRFIMKLLVSYPSESEYLTILDRTTTANVPAVRAATTGQEILELREVVRAVVVSEPVARYAARVIMATQPGSPNAPARVAREVALGASPRGLQAMILLGKVRALLDKRFAVSCRDIRDVATPALRHRLLLTFEAQANRVNPDEVIRDVVASVKELPEH